jgi:hypothetical protein
MLKFILSLFRKRPQPQPVSTSDPRWTAYKANLRREHLLERRERLNGLIPTMMEHIDKEYSAVLIGKENFMKNVVAAIVITLAMVVSASAQTPNNMRCFKPAAPVSNYYTKLCVFDDGTVNATSIQSDGTYSSDWYTKEEWAQWLERWHPTTEKQQEDATVKLCKKGVFDKPYCDAYMVKHKIKPAVNPN